MAEEQKKYALIIHDAYSHPSDHWYTSLATSLRNQGYVVRVPDFPTPAGQTLDYWNGVLEKQGIVINENTTLVGHGIGAAYILHLLSAQKNSAGDVFLVAPYYQKINHVGFDKVNETFYQETYDWEELQKHAKSFTIFYSGSDIYVPSGQALTLARELGAQINEIPKAEHFQGTSGYRDFTELATAIVSTSNLIPITPEEELATELTHAGITPPKKEVPTVQSPVKTYAADLTNTIKTSDASALAKLLRKEREDEEASRSRQKIRVGNSFQLVTIIILVLLGIVALTRIALPDSQAIISGEQTIPNIIAADHQDILAVDNLDSEQLLTAIEADIMQQPLQDGFIHDIVLTRSILGRTEYLRPRSLFSLFDTSIPGLLQQDFGKQFMYGIYHSNDYEPFLLIPITSLPRDRNSMATWESTIVTDLAPLLMIDLKKYAGAEAADFATVTVNNYRLHEVQTNTLIKREVIQLIPAVPATETIIDEAEVSSSVTATSDEANDNFTPPAFVTPATQVGPRSTVTEPGDKTTVLLYTFVRNDLLLIARSRETLSAVLGRLSARAN